MQIKKAPVTMMLAGGTLLTLIVSTNSLPGARAATSAAATTSRQVQLAISDGQAPADTPAVATPAPVSSTFAALLSEPWAEPAGSPATPSVAPKAKPATGATATAIKAGVPSAAGTTAPGA